MILSQTITVEDFFQRANWQGLKLVTIPEESRFQEEVVEDTFTPTFDLTVQDFFQQANWQGVVKTKFVQFSTSSDSSSSVSVVPPNYSLTMSVGEFFQRMPWTGQINYKKGSIASLPQVSPSNTFSSTVEPLNVNDLSDLL
ncbi:hypothetical protein [Geminocystis herdmanii]|uniref:hypothetical protein n=1 Tax=Geminocystis herdmanii TaxID=669359 RepID=UPI00034C4302|nr:hypothetical protein [Geminocystis herdmanii]